MVGRVTQIKGLRSMGRNNLTGTVSIHGVHTWHVPYTTSYTHGTWWQGCCWHRNRQMLTLFGSFLFSLSWRPSTKECHYWQSSTAKQWIYLCVRECVCVWVWVCVCVWVNVCVCVSEWMGECVCVCVCEWVNVCVCDWVYMTTDMCDWYMNTETRERMQFQESNSESQ